MSQVDEMISHFIQISDYFQKESLIVLTQKKTGDEKVWYQQCGIFIFVCLKNIAFLDTK